MVLLYLLFLEIMGAQKTVCSTLLSQVVFLLPGYALTAAMDVTLYFPAADNMIRLWDGSIWTTLYGLMLDPAAMDVAASGISSLHACPAFLQSSSLEELKDSTTHSDEVSVMNGNGK